MRPIFPKASSMAIGAGTLLMALACGPSGSQDSWEPTPGLKTRWAAEVDPAEPLGEYPRPQMIRPSWINLNGLWDFTIQPRDASVPEAFPDRILVPFPVESSLSGLARTVTPQDRVWYRRTFSLPGEENDGQENGGQENGGRWMLHFGAADWEAEVFVNGQSLGIHRGGYDPFSLDITESLIEGPEQEVMVGVWDPSSDGTQPRGKQVLDPHGIWYTAVTGIWQTVWLEPVPELYVSSVDITPDLEAEQVSLLVRTEGSPDPLPFQVTLYAEGNPILVEEGQSGAPLSLSVPEPRSWSPDDPFLYEVEIRIGNMAPGHPWYTDPAFDRVDSYFGMRSIAIAPDKDGHQRLLLNGEPLFEYGLLDQGWWPDGLYTAPTDDALRFDVEKTKELGFNLIRKHVKVEPARWYYHCDREGVLVWQDMPSGDFEGPEGTQNFAVELEAMVEGLRNHPSIIMWVPFNEGWGQHETEAYVDFLKEIDPTRLVNNASGWTDTGTGDVLDIHRYPGPGSPTPENISPLGPRAAVLGEFGGLGLPLAGHTWVDADNWGYRSFETLPELNEAYADLLTVLRPLIGEGLAAAIYTQTTDVEVEVNGIMTYDRKVVKLDDSVKELHAKLYGPPPTLRPVLPTSQREGQVWRFTETDPGPRWAESEFDDSAWQEGEAGFGSQGTPGAIVRTVWNTPEIWLRRSFSLTKEQMESLGGNPLLLRIHHDEDAQVFLNGEPIARLDGYTTGYDLARLSPEVYTLLQAGENLISVHVQQTGGGQYIDVGIVEWLKAEQGG